MKRARSTAGRRIVAAAMAVSVAAVVMVVGCAHQTPIPNHQSIDEVVNGVVEDYRQMMFLAGGTTTPPRGATR